MFNAELGSILCGHLTSCVAAFPRVPSCFSFPLALSSLQKLFLFSTHPLSSSLKTGALSSTASPELPSEPWSSSFCAGSTLLEFSKILQSFHFFKNLNCGNIYIKSAILSHFYAYSSVKLQSYGCITHLQNSFHLVKLKLCP